MSILSKGYDITKHTERFWSKVEKTSRCWLWIGGLDKDGYGSFTIKENQKGKRYRAHRVSFALANGYDSPVLIDHICRVPNCVNPDHLREADDAMNVLSGISPTAINARKARCIRGHEFDGTDRRGWRYCTQCHNEKRRQRRNASRPVPGTTNNESEGKA